jgi:hypothetical protein
MKWYSNFKRNSTVLSLALSRNGYLMRENRNLHKNIFGALNLADIGVNEVK